MNLSKTGRSDINYQDRIPQLDCYQNCLDGNNVGVMAGDEDTYYD